VRFQTVWYDIPVGKYIDQLWNLCFISLSLLCIQLQNFLLHLRNSLTDGSSFYLLLTSWHPVLPSSTSQERVTLNRFLPFPSKGKCGRVVGCLGINHQVLWAVHTYGKSWNPGASEFTGNSAIDFKSIGILSLELTITNLRSSSYNLRTFSCYNCKLNFCKAAWKKNTTLFSKQILKAPKTNMAGSPAQKKRKKKHLNYLWWKQTSIQSIPWAENLHNSISVNF